MSILKAVQRARSALSIAPSNERYNVQAVRTLARHRWRDILIELGIGPSFLNGRLPTCPAGHGGDAFRFENVGGHGTFRCTHELGTVISGDGIGLVKHVFGVPYSQAIEWVVRELGVDRDALARFAEWNAPSLPALPPGDKIDPSAHEEIRMILDKCVPISPLGAVARYLRNLGLEAILDDLPAALYEHPALEYREDGQRTAAYPAMVAPIVEPNGTVVALHLTYLSGGSRAPASCPTQLTRPAWGGATGAAAIRLYADHDIHFGEREIVIAEGIESALASRLLEGGAVWACESAQALKSVVVPQEMREVSIFSCTNEASFEAANELMKRLVTEGRLVTLDRPEDGLDYVSVWREQEQRAADEPECYLPWEEMPDDDVVLQ